jgi:hypothetical protein
MLGSEPTAVMALRAETEGKLHEQLQSYKRHATAAQQSKQQSKSKPATVTAKRHGTMGELLFFLQQAAWWSRHKGVNITGKLTLCTASSRGLGQQGH